MRLRQYLEATHESQAAFAERASRFLPRRKPRKRRGKRRGARKRVSVLSQTTISGMVTGEHVPRADLAYAVIRASQARPAPDGGTVTLEDLVSYGRG